MLERFILQSETSDSILLFAATVVALVWANSPCSSSYFTFWKIPLRLGRRPLLSMDLHRWIDDGLTVLLFLVVGLRTPRSVFTDANNS
jgi:Na+:H+ antiporter, NhaA family